MAATKADVLGPLATNLVKRDEVAQHKTAKRMADHGERSLSLKKRMTATACVFGCFRVGFHNMNAVAKEPAEVVDSLPEFVMTGIGVAGQLEKQRVSASLADVFIVSCAAGNDDVLMPAEKAGQRMSNSRNAAAPIKNYYPTASAMRGRLVIDCRVVDFMAQERASG